MHFQICFTKMQEPYWAVNGCKTGYNISQQDHLNAHECVHCDVTGARDLLQLAALFSSLK